MFQSMRLNIYRRWFLLRSKHQGSLHPILNGAESI
jgi:hypothetical protein